MPLNKYDQFDDSTRNNEININASGYRLRLWITNCAITDNVKLTECNADYKDLILSIRNFEAQIRPCTQFPCTIPLLQAKQFRFTHKIVATIFPSIAFNLFSDAQATRTNERWIFFLAFWDYRSMAECNE